jgi:hypothetical protein
MIALDDHRPNFFAHFDLFIGSVRSAISKDVNLEFAFSTSEVLNFGVLGMSSNFVLPLVDLLCP